MRKTVKIDFEPGLFDEGRQPEAAIGLPAIQPERRTNRTTFIVACILLLAGCVAVALLLYKSLKAQEAPFSLESYETRMAQALNQPHITPVGIGDSRPPLSPSARWCDGDEVICTTTTSEKPVETLQKLIAAIPQNSAKRYQIRLAVVSIDDSLLPDGQGAGSPKGRD